MSGSKGTIAILTGGGDVPGLNPAIRAVTIRALREGYRVLGIRRGWRGLVDVVPEDSQMVLEFLLNYSMNSKVVKWLSQQPASFANIIVVIRSRDI